MLIFALNYTYVVDALIAFDIINILLSDAVSLPTQGSSHPSEQQITTESFQR